jgi:hypothetical protein
MRLITPPSGNDEAALVANQAAQFRAALASESRSATLAHLFDYLLECSANDRAPKEIEIAMAVFGKSGEFDTSQDSTVRGHIHRLRQRLDNFNAGKNGPRLQIPKGEYRLILVDEPTKGEGTSPSGSATGAGGYRKAGWAIAIVLSASLLFWFAFYLFGPERRASSALAKTAFWRPIAEDRRLPQVAVGDFFFVAESGGDGKVRRVSMHPTIQSSKELGEYLAAHPEEFNRMHDRDIYRAPTAAVVGGASILSLVSSLRPDQGIADLVPVSKISQEQLETRNIINIEYFSQLGVLRSSVGRISGFVPGRDSSELKDIPSGRIFRASPSVTEDISSPGSPAAKSYGYDFGYIASYQGPSKNRIIIISGLEDAALSHMVKLVSDKKQLDLLAQRTNGAEAFEALYQIRTIGELVSDTKLVIARPLKEGGIRNQ